MFNTEDRLREVKDNADQTIATYYYDPFGRRLWKEVAGVRTYFHYVGDVLEGEYNTLGNEIKTYHPLLVKENGNYYFYHSDHLGTPHKITSTNGYIVWSATYDSFGKASVDVASNITNNIRFPGQYYDLETGLHYNHFRYYDSLSGRYLRLDPLGFNGGINIYEYALSNPARYTDPLGLVHRPGETTLEARIKHCALTRRCSKEEIEGLLALAEMIGDKAAIAAATALLVSYAADGEDGEECDDDTNPVPVPDIPTDPEELKEKNIEHDKKVSEDTEPITTTPPHFPPPEPEPTPKKFWKKVALVLMKILDAWANRP